MAESPLYDQPRSVTKKELIAESAPDSNALNQSGFHFTLIFSRSQPQR